MKNILALLLLVAFSSCAPRPGPSSNAAQPPSGYLAPGDPVREEILKEVTDYYDHMSAGDWKAYASHFWPGASITTVWQPPGEPAPRVVINSIPDWTGIDAFTLMRHDGNWKIVGLTFSGT